MKKQKLISVVIISRNEETTIDNCISSVINELKNYDFEIILVDSASSDKTIQIAKKYPVKILQLNNSTYLSPSAGRYIGTKECKGEYIIFMDSDVIMIKGFVKKALTHFKKDVAGVRGFLYRVYPGERLNKKHKEKVRFGNYDLLGGQTAVYRKSALDSCGTFNPFVKGEEERELNQRLRLKKFKLLIKNIPMCYHMEKQKDINEITEKAGYFTGVGQIMKKFIFKKEFWVIIKDHKYVFLEFFYLTITAAVLITLLILKQWIFIIILVLVIMMSLGIAVVLKGYKKIYIFSKSKILTIINIIKGFNMGIKDAKKFDKLVKVKIIK